MLQIAQLESDRVKQWGSDLQRRRKGRWGTHTEEKKREKTKRGKNF